MIEVGDRVRLEPSIYWLSQWLPLADSGRVGTVTSLPDDSTCEVAFDVKRPGAKIKAGTFFRGSLILVSKGPYEPPPQQEQLTLTGIAHDGRMACPACDGRGTVSDWGDAADIAPCEACDGTGHLPHS